MFDTMLIPLDGSPLGERALPTATALAEVTGGRLVLVQAVDDDEGRRTDNKRQAEAISRV